MWCCGAGETEQRADSRERACATVLNIPSTWQERKDPSSWPSQFQLCCLPNTCKYTHANTHHPHIPSAGTRMTFVTQTCLRKHQLEANWLRNNAINRGILTVCVLLQEEEWFFAATYQQPLFLFPFTSAWNPGIAQSDRDKRWEREGEQRGTARQTEAESVRDGHVRFPAPHTHTNTEPEMNCSGFGFLKSPLTWTLALCGCFTMKQREPSAPDALGKV